MIPQASSPADAVTVPIGPTELAYIRQTAKAAEIGGKSNIRNGNGERTATLREDQIIGQVATYALTRYLFGGTERYRATRWIADRYPTTGDGGSDVIGLNVDVKGSRIRTGRPLHEYRLAVRPNERHVGHVYVLALVELGEDRATVYLMGWARDEELPAPEGEGIFAGAHVIPAAQLHPLMPLRWWGKPGGDYGRQHYG